jgi:predicted nucleic acid-binding protein
MSGNRQFVDTNILLYAYDATADDKHERARELVERLWDTRDGCLSVQVLQEFFVNVTRKIPRPLDASTAKAVVADLARWRMHVPAADDVLGAIGIHQRTGISLWDGMIVRSAAEIGCAVICSEDLNHGQIYSGVRVVNPFRTEAILALIPAARCHVPGLPLSCPTGSASISAGRFRIDLPRLSYSETGAAGCHVLHLGAPRLAEVRDQCAARIPVPSLSHETGASHP